MDTPRWVINKEACEQLTEKKFSDEQNELIAKMAEALEQEIEAILAAE